MKQLKSILLGLTFLMSFTFTTISQVTGYSFQSFSIMPIDDPDSKVESSELFSFSMNDGYLCHTVLKDGNVIDSQFYRILSHDIKSYTEDGIEFVEISTLVMSGQSLSQYHYTLYITNEYNVLTIGDVMYVGVASILKTYKQ